MSSELERRLEGFLADLPDPEPEVGERALATAVAALRPAAPVRRGLRSAVLVLAAGFVLLGIAAGSLAAVGALHVGFGPKTKPRPRTGQLSMPKGASGVAAVVDGRLSVVTKGGFRLQGLPVTAAALSPHALYVAAGIGHSLVAMAPDGRRAWSHPAGGAVVAIAWAPDGLRIAYVVRTKHRLALHVIWGNGTNDAVIDRAVRAVRPSWQASSLAFAYVGEGGSPAVYDLAHRSRHLVAVSAPVSGVSFAPSGDALAVDRVGGVSLVRQDGRVVGLADGAVEAFGWLNGRLAVAVPARDSALIRLFAPSGAGRGSRRVYGRILAITPRLVVVRERRRLVAGHTTLLDLTQRTSVRDLQIG